MDAHGLLQALELLVRDTMKAAYLPLYVRDWRSDPKVAFLEWSERALYLDMLMLSWELGPLPNDARKILRALGAPHAEDAVMSLLRTFFEHSEEGWTNPRLEAERDRTERLVAANAARGRRSVRSRRARVTHESLGRGSHVTPTSQGTRAPEPEPEPEPVPSTLEHRVPDTPSLRSGVAASAAENPGLPGIDAPQRSRNRELTPAQADGFTARSVWCRCWLEQFGTPYTDLSGRKSGAVRTAFVRLERDEALFERVVRAFLADPPFKARENPDPIALLDNLASTLSHVDGKGKPTGGSRDGQRNGSRTNARRTDGTRPGEYPEPLQFPRVADLTAG